MLGLNCQNVQHVKIYLPCNFEVNPITHFDRLCKLKIRGDEIFKKSSPLKLLSQSQPNCAEMILGWSSSKIVSGIFSIFSNGGHLGYRTALTDTILKGDHLRIISAKFG
jgi:hypothetical protein